MLPDGMSLQIAYSPKADGLLANDKAGTGGSVSGKGAGWDIVVAHSGLMDGLNVFAGTSNIDQPIESSASTTSGDRTQYGVGATYAIGSVTLGYQYTRDNLQNTTGGGVTSYYENDAFGVSFNVSDDLSISYGNHKSERHLDNATVVELEAESLQLAYSMGGASIKVAESSVDNGSYTSGTGQDRDGTTIALSLAF
jgi:hypothetical protein